MFAEGWTIFCHRTTGEEQSAKLHFNEGFNNSGHPVFKVPSLHESVGFDVPLMWW